MKSMNIQGSQVPEDKVDEFLASLIGEETNTPVEVFQNPNLYPVAEVWC